MAKKPEASDGLAMPTCRICGEHTQSEILGPFLRYSSGRHYAHMACFVNAGKRRTLLTTKQVRELDRWIRSRK